MKRNREVEVMWSDARWTSWSENQHTIYRRHFEWSGLARSNPNIQHHNLSKTNCPHVKVIFIRIILSPEVLQSFYDRIGLQGGEALYLFQHSNHQHFISDRIWKISLALFLSTTFDKIEQRHERSFILFWWREIILNFSSSSIYLNLLNVQTRIWTSSITSFQLSVTHW